MNKKKSIVLAVVVLVLAASVSAGAFYVKNRKQPEEKPVAAKEEPAETKDPHEGKAKSLLTGEWVDATLVKMRPAAVMVEDTKPALPHYGLNRAGVIYECPVEGGYTRLMAIMEDYADLDKIGNVRSCRPYYAYIAAEFDAVYVHFGQSVQGLEVLKSGVVDDLNGLDGKVEKTVFYRTNDRKAPYNAYTSGKGITEGIKKKGYGTAYQEGYQGHYLFASDDAPVTLANGMNATVIKPYYHYNKPYFVYNKDTGLYERYQFGGAQIDGTDQKQVCVKNIIFQNVPSSLYSGTQYLNIPLNGSGEGKYFTGGKMVDITWEKKSNSDITRYYDASGNEIVLNQGKTWVCLIQNSSAKKNQFFATVEEFEAQ